MKFEFRKAVVFFGRGGVPALLSEILNASPQCVYVCVRECV